MSKNYSYHDILNHCNTMSFLNVISFCLLSGIGNIDLPQESELKQIYLLLDRVEDEKRPFNVYFMSGLYKSCKPYYVEIPQTPYDFIGFQWSSKRCKKVILPEIMAYSISCLTALCNKIILGDIPLQNKDFIIYSFLLNAIKQFNFVAEHLELGGMYYPGKDIGSNAYGEYNIEIESNSFSLSAQFEVLESAAGLRGLICNINKGYREVVDKIGERLKILPLICSNVINEINIISSRELSTICNSLLSMYESCPEYRDIIYNAVNNIGCELYERIENNGDVCRSAANSEPSSFTTIANCLNCFCRLVLVNDSYIYYNACSKLYDKIDSCFDSKTGIFINSGKSKLKYTIKDIAFIISALRSYRNILVDSDLFKYVDNQLSSFYSSAIIKSKIFNSQIYPILQDCVMDLPNLGTKNPDKAPVFSKQFEIKLSKKKYYCESDLFDAEYILCACKHLIY